MPWGIWIILECVQLLMLPLRWNKLLQICLHGIGLLLLLIGSLLLTLSLFLIFGLDQFLFFLSLFLHMSFHICNFVLYCVQLLMEFLVLASFLVLSLIVLKQSWATCVFYRLSASSGSFSIFFSLSLDQSWVFLISSITYPNCIVIAIHLNFISPSALVILSVSIVIRRVMITILVISFIPLHSTFQAFVCSLLSLVQAFGLRQTLCSFSICNCSFHRNYKIINQTHSTLTRTHNRYFCMNRVCYSSISFLVRIGLLFGFLYCWPK